MIILGLVLLAIGFIADIAVLWAIGVALLVIGVVLWVVGSWAALSAADDTIGSQQTLIGRAALAAPGRSPRRYTGPRCRRT